MLRKLLSDVAATSLTADGWLRRTLFEELARTICALPEPLLLVLDDLQWCDSDALECLHYLMRFAAHNRLFVVDTARPGELDTDQPRDMPVR